MSEVKTVSKAEQAQVIFAEVNGVRADFIKRVMEELGMGKPGASTYFQNCKTKANGGKVKHYRPKKAEGQQQHADDDKETFGVALKDGQLKIFGSQQERDDFIEANADLIAEDQGEEAA